MGSTASTRPLALTWIAGIGLGFFAALYSDVIGPFVPWDLGHDRIVIDLVLLSVVPGFVMLSWSLVHPRLGARLPMWLGLIAGAAARVLMFYELENPEGLNPLGAFGNAIWGPAMVFAPLVAMAIAEIVHAVRRRRQYAAPGEQALQPDASR